MKQRRNIRAIVYDIVNDIPWFFLLKARKGYWQFPQGGIDQEEDDIDAVVRELWEEAGLVPTAIQLETSYDTSYRAMRKGKPRNINLRAYALRADLNQLPIIGSEGHTACVCATYDKALELLGRYPEQREVFEAVCRKAGLRY